METPGVSATAAQSMLLASLISALHQGGLLPIAAVLEEFEEACVAYALKNPRSQVSDFVTAQMGAMTALADKLGPFVPAPR